MTTAGAITADTLKAIPIFSGCSSEELRAIAPTLESTEVGEGEAIFREGDPGEEMYIIASGQVRVVSDVETERSCSPIWDPVNSSARWPFLPGAVVRGSHSHNRRPPVAIEQVAV